MKKYTVLLLLSAFFVDVHAQTSATDTGTFLLHKFQQKIGKETYQVSHEKDAIIYQADFKFVDRGSPVPLKAELRVNPALDPLALSIKGNVARGATVNDTIRINGKAAYVKVDDSVYHK